LLRLGFIAAVVTSSLVVVVTNASAGSVTATSGHVSATFTYEGTIPQSRNARLTISHNGKVVDRVAVRSKWCGNQCWPDFASPGHSILHVVRLRDHGPLDVVLDLYSGGAHCCTVEQVFSPKGSSGAYRSTEYDFGDPGVRLLPLGQGGSDVFLSADDSFAYAFTDYAASAMPIEILSFYAHSFHNVTKSFPRLIETDAKQWRVAFNAAASSHYQDTVGLAAAWAADEDLLGHVATAQRFLQLEARAGHLNSLVSPLQSSGQRFVVQLQNFLAKHGYVKTAS
jgi:hypothetical protein